MPNSKPKPFYRITYDGRVEVDTNRLVYSKKGQDALEAIDRGLRARDAEASKSKER